MSHCNRPGAGAECTLGCAVGCRFPFSREAMHDEIEAQIDAHANEGGLVPETQRWTQDEVDSLGADRGFLPERYWPEADVAPKPVVNPKEGAGAAKPSTWSVMPRWVMLIVGRVMEIGAAKYDAFNYREAKITASIYEDAMERHAALWFDGEDNDPETGVSHLGSVIASCSLLMDSQAGGMLVDNRQKTGKVRKALDELTALRTSHPLPPKNPNAPSMQRQPLARTREEAGPDGHYCPLGGCAGSMGCACTC